MIARFESAMEYNAAALYDATIIAIYDTIMEGSVSIYALHPDITYESPIFYSPNFENFDIYENIETQYETDITYERAYHHHKVILNKAFLNIRFPRFIESHEKLIELIKKAGINETVHAKFEELKHQGYEQINTTQYAKLLLDGITPDIQFTNRVLYIKLKKMKKRIRKLWEYKRFDISGHSCIIRSVLSISSQSTDSKDAILNMAKANKGKVDTSSKIGYRLGKMWITVYNPKTRHLIHAPIAKSSKLYGVQVEGFEYQDSSWQDIQNEYIELYYNQPEIITEKGSFNVFSSNKIGDIGLSCNPAKIVPNRHTFQINTRTGLVPVLYNECANNDDSWVNMIYLIKKHGCMVNFNAIRNRMVYISNTYMPFDIELKKILSGSDTRNISKAIESAYIPQKIENLYVDKDDIHWTLYMWYKYVDISKEGTFIIGFKQIRPCNAKSNDYYGITISDIYGIFYDVKTKTLATPLIASDGTLNQVTTVPIQPLYLAKYNRLTIIPINIIRIPLSGSNTLKSLCGITNKYTVESTINSDYMLNIKDIMNVQNKLKSVIAHEHSINANTFFTKDLSQVVKNNNDVTILLASIPQEVAYENLLGFADTPRLKKDVELAITHIKNANIIISQESIHVKAIDVVYDKDIKIIGHLK
jgi:hypothetical protein